MAGSWKKVDVRPLAETPAEYWSRYHVDAPSVGFASAADSLNHFAWRSSLYPGYIELMPVDKADGLVILDYGCGPGNDVIGFGHFSRPAAIHALDVSPLSIAIAQERARLHGIAADFGVVRENPARLPLGDASIDLIHCSGVLHHTADPEAILGEFRRVLKPGGHGQIMVYHHDSLWMHLYTAYQKMLVEGQFSGLTKRAAFEKTMDGDDCPIARCYTASEFSAMANRAGLTCAFRGASMSLTELKLLPGRFAAIEDRRLDAESRQFLSALTFNERGWPLFNGVVAGVNACFSIAAS